MNVFLLYQVKKRVYSFFIRFNNVVFPDMQRYFPVLQLIQIQDIVDDFT